MPKWTDTKVAGYTLYFTTHDGGEPVHSHASTKRLVEAGSAKIWVYQNGDTEVADSGNLSATEIRRVCKFITENKQDLFEVWHKTFGDLEFFGEPGKKFGISEKGEMTMLTPFNVFANKRKNKE